jgi:hypothetical protein
MAHLDLALNQPGSAFPRLPYVRASRLQAHLTVLRPALGELLTLGAFLAMCIGLMAEFS